MKSTDIQHIFFDLDHTLWDFDRNSELAFADIFKNRKIEVPIAKFLKTYMPINLKYWRMYRNNTVSKEELRFQRLRESFEILKYRIDDEMIDILADDYVEYLPKYNFLLDGSLNLLDYLQKKYDLHIITNGFEEVQHKKLYNSGIAQYFKSITTSEEVGVKKPDPKIFHKALEKSGAKIKNSVMVGDSIEADVLGAQNIGMRAIYFNYYKSDLPVEYDGVLELSEIKNIL